MTQNTELSTFCEQQRVKVTEAEVQFFAPQLLELRAVNLNPGEAALRIRRMVYESYMLDKKAAREAGTKAFKSFRPRGHHDNERLIACLSEFAQVDYHYQLSAEDKRLDEIMSDPCKMAAWFEELDIMN